MGGNWKGIFPAPICIFLIALALSLQLSAQQVITLRFIDYESGKPISHVSVGGYFWNGTPGKNQVTVSKVSAKSSKDGVIKLSVPMPTPDHLNVVSFDTAEPLSADLSVGQVLTGGITLTVHKDGGKTSKTLPPENPGQILVMTRKLSLGSKIAREFP